jgi:hypothetical protein
MGDILAHIDGGVVMKTSMKIVLATGIGFGTLGFGGSASATPIDGRKSAVDVCTLTQPPVGSRMSQLWSMPLEVLPLAESAKSADDVINVHYSYYYPPCY